MQFVLKDQQDPLNKAKMIEGEVYQTALGQLEIAVRGYGEKTAEVGWGRPIVLDLYEGRLRVLAFNDINTEDPVIVDMENARESLYKEQE